MRRHLTSRSTAIMSARRTRYRYPCSICYTDEILQPRRIKLRDNRSLYVTFMSFLGRRLCYTSTWTLHVPLTHLGSCLRRRFRSCVAWGAAFRQATVNRRRCPSSGDNWRMKMLYCLNVHRIAKFDCFQRKTVICLFLCCLTCVPRAQKATRNC